MLALTEFKKENKKSAEQLLKKATQAAKGDPLSYKNAAIAFEVLNDHGSAIHCYQQCLALTPKDIDTQYRLGLLHKARNENEKAAIHFQNALQLKPDFPEVLLELGNIETNRSNFDKAIQLYKKALQLKQNYPEALSNLGVIFLREKKYDEAEKYLLTALQQKPNHFEAILNLGLVMKEMKKYDEAIQYFQKAKQLKPNAPDIYLNLGSLFGEQNNYDEAIACYEKILQLDPDSALAYKCLGTALSKIGKHEEGINYFRKALMLDHTLAVAHAELGLLLLLSGNFEEGWNEIEWRFQLEAFRDIDPNRFPQPLYWQGQSLKNKTIVIVTEQGVGDIIQFIRYIELVKKQGGKIILQCVPLLFKLLSSIDGIDQFITKNDPLPPFDFYCPLLSLARIFKTDATSIPKNVPYIHANSDLASIWSKRISNKQKFNVGFVWAGNPKYLNDEKRSCQLTNFEMLFDVPNVTFYSMQKGEQTKLLKDQYAKDNVINLDPELNDFSDTAAIIEQFDLVISVDTAVAHLAGAMGKPTWLLLPFVPDWRWLLDREDSPWYPTMRLFRQKKIGDWNDVFKRIKKTLIKEIKKTK